MMSKPLYSATEQTRLRGVERAVESLKRRTRGYATILDGGTAVTPRDTVDFVGATITDDSVNAKTVVTLSGGGASGLTAAFANHGQYSHAYGSRNTIIFNDFWTNDSANFSYTDLVTDPQFSRANGALTYIQIVDPGLYEIVYQTNDSWPAGSYFEPSVDYGSGFDTLLNYLNNQMFDSSAAHSDAYSSHSGSGNDMHARTIVDIPAASMPAGYLKIGFNIRCSGSSTCTWSGMLGVTKLGANMTETWLGP